MKRTKLSTETGKAICPEKIINKPTQPTQQIMPEMFNAINKLIQENVGEHGVAHMSEFQIRNFNGNKNDLKMDFIVQAYRAVGWNVYQTFNSKKMITFSKSELYSRLNE